MANDLIDPTLSANTTDGEQPNNAANSGGQVSGESTAIQSEHGDNGNGKIGIENTVPPELEETRKQLMRDYHEKMRSIKEDKLRTESENNRLRNEASTLQQLMQQEWFKKATDAERARRSGQVVEIGLSDEEFSTATTDKKAFQNLIYKIADQVASAKVGKVEPQLGQNQEALEELKREREFDTVASKYKDFRDLNNQGALDPYLERGFDFETAYARYRLDHHPAAPKQETQIDPETQRAGSVSPGGVTRVNGQRIIKAKNLDEAMDLAFEALQKGDKNFKIERATK